MKVTYYFDSSGWFGGFSCPLCFEHISSSKLLYEDKVGDNALITCDRCGEMLLCMGFTNEINIGLGIPKESICDIKISKVKMLINFFNFIMSSTDKYNIKNARKTLLAFVDKGNVFYQTSLLKINKITTYKEDDIEPELNPDLEIEKEYELPGLLTFDKIFNFNNDLDLDDIQYFDYEAECTECDRKYSSNVNLIETL